MCQECVDLVRKYYPELPDEKYGDFLMSATCFPFGKPADIEKQFIEYKEKTDGSVQVHWIMPVINSTKR